MSNNVPPSSASQKKEREVAHYRHAQRLAPTIFPEGLLDDRNENPDIVVQSHAGTYGVEVTELMTEDMRREEARRTRVVRGAASLFHASHPRCALRVQVLFLPTAPLTTLAEQSLATDELATLVQRMTESEHEPQWKRDCDFDRGAESEFFQKVWVNCHPLVDKAIWNPIEAWWVRRLHPADVVARIQEKATRAPEYRKRAQFIYLLLVVDGFSGASALQIDRDCISTINPGQAFDKVLILDHANGVLHQLPK